MKPEQAQSALPVAVSGVVTFVNSRSGEFWIEEESAGIRVSPGPLGRDLSPGLRVQIVGVTGFGEFSPLLVPNRVTVLGMGELPPGVPCSFALDSSCLREGQFVLAHGIVLNARSFNDTTRIDVIGRDGHAVLVIEGAQWAVELRRLRNEEISFRGVCTSRSTDRRATNSPVVYINELPTPVPRPGVEPDTQDPTRILNQLLEFMPHPGLRHVKVAGVVTAIPLPNLVIVQNLSGGVCVWTDRANTVTRGAQVEVTGLMKADGRQFSVVQAQIQETGTGPLPAPVELRVPELASGQFEARIVRLTGRLEEVRTIDSWTAVTVAEDGQRFRAYLPGNSDSNGLASLAAGSLVSVVGTSAAIAPDGAPARLPGVFLASADFVAVLEPPPPPEAPAAPSWWTSTNAGYLASGFALVMLLGCGWVVSLRVQVRRAAAEVKGQFEERARLERQLRQASKLEAVGRLAGGIAHDFNNLLTVINGCAELLSEEALRDGGRLSGLTDDIRKAGERAAALTGQLLTFSRKREVTITAVNLNEVVTDTLRLLDRVIGEDIRIETHLAGELPAVRGEPGLLHQIMMNLAVNARDAMPHGGVMSFSTCLVADTKAGPDGSDEPPRVRLTVADTGVGMTDEVKARLFEPFFTTKEVGSGTGLGLATVYGIIQTIGGRVRVASALGTGTRFDIDLRIHGVLPSDTESSMSLATPFPPTRGANKSALAGKTILLVEDNEMVRQTLLAGLADEGATLLSADRPETALAVIQSHRGPIDVLVTDVVMPGMSGPSLAERVREARPETTVIFISGYTADEVLRKGVLEEQVEFLQKPFTPDHLVRRLRRVLARGSGPGVTASAP